VDGFDAFFRNLAENAIDQAQRAAPPPPLPPLEALGAAILQAVPPVPIPQRPAPKPSLAQLAAFQNQAATMQQQGATPLPQQQTAPPIPPPQNVTPKSRSNAGQPKPEDEPWLVVQTMNGTAFGPIVVVPETRAQTLPEGATVTATLTDPAQKANAQASPQFITNQPLEIQALFPDPNAKPKPPAQSPVVFGPPQPEPQPIGPQKPVSPQATAAKGVDAAPPSGIQPASSYNVVQAIVNGQPVRIAVTPQNWETYYQNDPDWEVVQENVPGTQVVKDPTVRALTPQDTEAQRAKGVRPYKEPEGPSLAQLKRGAASAAGTTLDIVTAPQRGTVGNVADYEIAVLRGENPDKLDTLIGAPIDVALGFDTPDIASGGMDPFREWIRANPEAAMAAHDQGGGDAVWNAYQDATTGGGVTGFAERTVNEILTDPLTLTGVARQAGRPLTAGGRALRTNQAATVGERAIGAGVETVGRALQAPYQAFERPVEMVFSGGAWVLRNTPGIKQGLRSSLASDINTNVNNFFTSAMAFINRESRDTVEGPPAPGQQAPPPSEPEGPQPVPALPMTATGGTEPIPMPETTPVLPGITFPQLAQPPVAGQPTLPGVNPPPVVEPPAGFFPRAPTDRPPAVAPTQGAKAAPIPEQIPDDVPAVQINPKQIVVRDPANRELWHLVNRNPQGQLTEVARDAWGPLWSNNPIRVTAQGPEIVPTTQPLPASVSNLQEPLPTRPPAPPGGLRPNEAGIGAQLEELGYQDLAREYAAVGGPGIELSRRIGAILRSKADEFDREIDVAAAIAAAIDNLMAKGATGLRIVPPGKPTISNRAGKFRRVIYEPWADTGGRGGARQGLHIPPTVEEMDAAGNLVRRADSPAIKHTGIEAAIKSGNPNALIPFRRYVELVDVHARAVPADLENPTYRAALARADQIRERLQTTAQKPRTVSPVVPQSAAADAAAPTIQPGLLGGQPGRVLEQRVPPAQAAMDVGEAGRPVLPGAIAGGRLDPADVLAQSPQAVGDEAAAALQRQAQVDAGQQGLGATPEIPGRVNQPPAAQPGVENVPRERIVLDPDTFQPRSKRTNKAGLDQRHLKDMEAQGWDWMQYEPIKLWERPEDGALVLMGGHHRNELASRLGVGEMPSKVYRGITKEQAQRIADRDNRLGLDMDPSATAGSVRREYDRVSAEGSTDIWEDVRTNAKLPTKREAERYYRISHLPQDILDELDSGRITEVAAEPMAKAVVDGVIPTAKVQSFYRNHVVPKGLNTADIENWVRGERIRAQNTGQTQGAMFDVDAYGSQVDGIIEAGRMSKQFEDLQSHMRAMRKAGLATDYDILREHWFKVRRIETARDAAMATPRQIEALDKLYADPLYEQARRHPLLGRQGLPEDAPQKSLLFPPMDQAVPFKPLEVAKARADRLMQLSRTAEDIPDIVRGGDLRSIRNHVLSDAEYEDISIMLPRDPDVQQAPGLFGKQGAAKAPKPLSKTAREAFFRDRARAAVESGTERPTRLIVDGQVNPATRQQGPQNLAGAPYATRPEPMRDEYADMETAGERLARLADEYEAQGMSAREAETKALDDTMVALTEWFRAVKEARTRKTWGSALDNRVVRILGRVYDRLMGLVRESYLYGPLTGGRYVATQYVGNTVTLLLTGQFDALPDALSPRQLITNYKAYKEEDFWGQRALLMTDPHKFYNEVGLSVAGDVRSVWADQVEMNPKTMWHRTMGGGKVGGAASNLIAVKSFRDFAHATDLNFRESLALAHMNRQWRGGLDSFSQAALTRKGATPELVQQFIRETEGRFSMDDVINWWEPHVGRGQAIRLGRDWQNGLRTMDDNARRAVRETFFYGTRNADEILGRVFLFHYWMARSSVLYARHVLKNPWMAASYFRVMQEMEEIEGRPDVPDWMNNMVPMLRGVYGYDIFTSPLALMQGFILARQGEEFTPEDESKAFGFLRKTGLFLGAPLAAAAHVLGFAGQGPIIDPSGVSQFTRPLVQVLNAGRAIGIVPGDGVIPEPTQELLQFIQRFASDFMGNTLNFPGATAIVPGDSTDLAEREINWVIIDIAGEQGLVSPDIAERAKSEENGQRYLPEDVQAAFSNPDHALWQEAYQRVSFKNLAMTGVRATPLGVTYPVASLASRNEVNYIAGDDTLASDDPLKQQAYAEREAANMISPEGAELLRLDDQYRAIGTPEQRAAYEQYNAIAYNDADPNPPEMKRAAADMWAAQNGVALAIEELEVAREEFEQANPEYAAFKQFQRDVRKGAVVGNERVGGPVEYWQQLIGGNPSAAEYYRRLGPEGQANEFNLTSPDAFLAQQGIRGDYRSPGEMPTRDMENVPYSPTELAAGVGGTQPPYEKKSLDQRITEDIAAYQAELAAFDKLTAQVFPGQGPIRVDQMDPMSRNSFIASMEQYYGVRPPELSSDTEMYLRWAEAQPAGSDTSPKSYAKWYEATMTSMGFPPDQMSSNMEKIVTASAAVGGP
jgi:hypothetical protein